MADVDIPLPNRTGSWPPFEGWIFPRELAAALDPAFSDLLLTLTFPTKGRSAAATYWAGLLAYARASIPVVRS